MCILKILIGSAMIIGGVILEIAWHGVCFGTVIVGIVMLIFAPGLLLIPFTFCITAGFAIISSCDDN